MNDFIAVAQKQCPVCLCIHEHDTEVLINKKLRPIKEEEKFTGHALCEEHDNLFKKGYVALIGVHPMPEEAGSKIQLSDPDRTGMIAHVARDFLKELISIPFSEKDSMMFIDQEALDYIKDHVSPDEDESTP